MTIEKSAIEAFLHAVDDELALHAKQGERLDLYILGRAALIVRFGVNLATKDVDVVTHRNDLGLERTALELFGAGTPNALRWRLYLEGVGAGHPPVPGRYQNLAVDLPGEWKVLRPRLLELHDLAITKLRRYHSGDSEDLRIICDSGAINPGDLLQALDSAFPFGIDPEDPFAKGVKEHFDKVVEYLEGRARDL